jgi:hypothetical protein
VTPSSFAKSVGFARRQVRYAKPSARQVGGANGRCGQYLKAVWVLQQHTRCTRVLRSPREQKRLASVCWNFVWYQWKSPCDERMARRR